MPSPIARSQDGRGGVTMQRPMPIPLAAAMRPPPTEPKLAAQGRGRSRNPACRPEFPSCSEGSAYRPETLSLKLKQQNDKSIKPVSQSKTARVAPCLIKLAHTQPHHIHRLLRMQIAQSTRMKQICFSLSISSSTTS